MVLADSHGISRAPCYSGTLLEVQSVFAYGAITPYGPSFQNGSANTWIGNFVTVPTHRPAGPTTPARQRRRAITPCWFRLFPFRSPLLRESRLLSLPRGTEMFQFPRFSLSALCVQTEVTGHYPSWVSPFGYPRVKACLTAHRGFSQPATSFIVS